ncbi:hypothetical protein GCM10029964_082480 [Kibdelosporangium lantanae]
MRNPGRRRSLIAMGLLTAVSSTVLVASVGGAAEAHPGSPPDWVGSWAAAVTRGNLSGAPSPG